MKGFSDLNPQRIRRSACLTIFKGLRCDAAYLGGSRQSSADESLTFRLNQSAKHSNGFRVQGCSGSMGLAIGGLGLGVNDVIPAIDITCLLPGRGMY